MKWNLMACLLLAFGFGAWTAALAAPPHKHSHDHAHGEHGPHGGDLIELGAGDFHAELVHDEQNDLVAIYLLDAKAKQSVAAPLKEVALNFVANRKPVQYKLLASPVKGDPQGHASRFSVKDRALCRLISDSPELTGRLSIVLNGKQYVGKIHHHAHDHDHAAHGHSTKSR